MTDDRTMDIRAIGRLAVLIGLAAIVGLPAFAAPAAFSDWPEGLDPKTVGRRVIDQFLSTDPEGYKGEAYRKTDPKARIAKGFSGYNYGADRYICYSVSSLFVHAMEFADLTDDSQLLHRLDDLFLPFLPGWKKQEKVTLPFHVDLTVFGAVPLQHALMTGNDWGSLPMGVRYADAQWAEPRVIDENFSKDPQLPWLLKHLNPIERQWELYRAGYSPQTRLWIDDMYMIGLLQTAAYRLTRDRRYLDRAAKEMVLYLDRLQLADGLFNHAADVPFRWGRGNGWMAAAMPLVLQYLKPGDEHYDRILAGYRKMMATLLKHQRASGLWGQLVDVDDPRNWDESSGSLMFAYAFIKGCSHGWLDAAVYAPAARKAYLAIAGSLDRYANVPNVCVGTNAKDSLEYYFARERANGDPHGQAPLLWCVNALIAYDEPAHPLDFPPEGFKLTRLQTSCPPPLFRRRRRAIEPVAEGALRLVPTYVSCSVVWGSAERADLRLEYRARGAASWTVGEKPVWFADVANYRGSILRLAESTDYEMRLVSGGETVASGVFRTWSSDVPVAKTVVIDPATAKYPIAVKDRGTPDGWIRYTAKKGAVLGRADLMTGIFSVDGAQYVLLDDLTLVGGGGYPATPISVRNAKGVRIRNCELSGYGHVGEPDLAQGNGQIRWNPKTEKVGRWTSWDTGIMLHPGVEEITVERCYIHDPRCRSNSWYYSHPFGTEGIYVHTAHHSVVLRWNDIVGSDLHRWNDTVGSSRNFAADGGFNRDADIYGNFLIFANDDNIELDGGQQNVRCFDNRFESGISGISIQGCCTSPSYVFDNLLGPCCEEFGRANPAIKTSSYDRYWFAPYTLISGNWLPEREFVPARGQTSRFDIRGNTFCPDAVPDAVTAKYPVRDLPFVLDTGLLTGIRIRGSAVTPATRTFRAIATAPQPFRVRQNLDGDWYRVEPSEGTLKVGENVFTVTFVPERMVGRRHYRAAFLLRTPEGLSRAVSVYAERTDFEPPLRPVPPSETTVYADCPAGRAAKIPFTVGKGGDYWLFLRIKSEDPAENPTPLARDLCFPDLVVSLDGGPERRMRFWAHNNYFVWSIYRHDTEGAVWSGKTRPHHLPAGRHELAIGPYKRHKPEQRYVVTGIAITDQPLAFEPTSPSSDPAPRD